ncbi:unnamed protein product [Callosobruchus maculatus]|uniref:Uncharacterized protein n=1 Tax=Callosobruchus maculatus TaxID=64391 RepID=A0A653DY79_CALMS|nr:unnamed protein product [Callosobruchus maculatus]
MQPRNVSFERPQTGRRQLSTVTICGCPLPFLAIFAMLETPTVCFSTSSYRT